MNDRIGKDHTVAYDYLKAVAHRLHIKFEKSQTIEGRCANIVQESVVRHCAREWDDAVVKALDAHDSRDVCAAVARLKEGKRWLTFLEGAPQQKAA